MEILKVLVLCLILFFTSCKTPQIGSGGGGGSTPTADDLNDYIDRMTSPESKTCSDVKTDGPSVSKYPVIYPSGKFQWKNEFSKSIGDQFNKDYMRPLKKQKINEGDLSLLGCTGYNYATDDEKQQFWILFLASVSKPESNFDQKCEFKEDDGTTSKGLLQIDPAASNNWCGIISKEKNKQSFNSEDMLIPDTNLQCGLLMMQTQVMGVPKGKPFKMTQPQLEGRLFTGNSFWYWSTLSDRNSNGKKECIDWFRVHAQRQLKFCNRKNPIDGYTPGLSSKYKAMNCEGVQDSSERENCDKYIVNAKIEMNIRLGENPIQNACQIIDNTNRNFSKTGISLKEIKEIESETISK